VHIFIVTMHQNGALIVPNETIILFLAHIHHELLH
jgi:hypothetical protein